MTESVRLGLVLLSCVACSRPVDAAPDAHGADAACVAPMPAPCSPPDAAPQLEGELHIDQGIGPYANIRFERHEMIVSLVANGLFDWVRNQPGLATLGLAEVSTIELEVPREGCRFSATAPAVHTCVLVAAGDSEVAHVRVRFLDDHGTPLVARESSDASARGAAQVFVLQEKLVYDGVISADGEEPTWVLTIGINFSRGAEHALFEQTFTGRALPGGAQVAVPR